MDERGNNKKKIRKKYSHTNITVIRERRKRTTKSYIYALNQTVF